MAQWTCDQCGIEFTRDSQGPSRPARFCGQACYRQWRDNNHVRAGCFDVGSVAWNKGKKGTHFSPATEFKKGCAAPNKLPVGTVTFRHRKREKSARAWIKVAEPNIWRVRAVVVWEAAHGPLPKGFVIHHKDEDPLNDDLANLVALSRAAHLACHRKAGVPTS